MWTVRSGSLAVVASVALLVGAAVFHASAKENTDPTEKLRADIRATVADPGRASKMLTSVDEMHAAVGELDRLIADERASLGALLRDHGSSRAAIDASLAEFNPKRESIARRVLAVHAALKSEATAAEWKKLKKSERDMILFAAAKSIGQSTVEKED